MAEKEINKMKCNICKNKEEIIAKGWHDIDYDATCDLCGNNIKFDAITVRYKSDVNVRGKRFHLFNTKIVIACLSCGVSGKGIKMYCGDWEAGCFALFEKKFVEEKIK